MCEQVRGGKGTNDSSWGKKVVSQLALKEINRDILDGDQGGRHSR